MKDFLNKCSIGTYILASGVLFTLIAFITALISCSGKGFAIAQLPLIIALSIITIVVLTGAIYLSVKSGDSFIITLITIAAIVLLTFCIIQMIEGKEDVLGTVMFSDLEKGYAPAEFACYCGVVSIVFYIIATLLTAISTFFKLNKD